MRVCAEPGCPELSDSSYCQKHKRKHREIRSEAGQRAQDWYKSARWAKRRKQQLARQPYCQCPECKGRKVKATIADHCPPHRGNEHAFWNGPLMSLSKTCHDAWAQRRDQAFDREGN